MRYSEYWAPVESTATFVDVLSPPAHLPVTSVVAMIIHQDRLLLTQNPRGWDVPGGHIEPGETPEDALVREVKEETGGTLGRFVLIGYLHIVKQKEIPENAKYGPEGAILIYASDDIELDDGYDLTQHESTAARWAAIPEVTTLHHDWSDMKGHILRVAQSAIEQHFTAS